MKSILKIPFYSFQCSCRVFLRICLIYIPRCRTYHEGIKDVWLPRKRLMSQWATQTIAIKTLTWKRKCASSLLRFTFLKPVQTSQRRTHKEILRLLAEALSSILVMSRDGKAPNWCENINNSSAHLNVSLLRSFHNRSEIGS